MRAVRAFALFWVDFVVGDDWVIAAGVALALAATALLVHAGYRVWWLVPLAAVAVLAASLARGARQARSRDSPGASPPAPQS